MNLHDMELDTPCARAVIGVLSRFVSAPNARSALRLAMRRAKLTAENLTFDVVDQLTDPLRDGISLFVREPAALRECVAALNALASPRASAAAEARNLPQMTPVRAEMDVVVARNDARTLARSIGFTETGCTRVATVVSELARNIFRYAGEGEIELRAASAPAGIHVIARDRGPGIADLASILDGRYRSKEGMGLGLRGVRSVASRFDVQTAPGRGTTVTAFIEVT